MDLIISDHHTASTDASTRSVRNQLHSFSTVGLLLFDLQLLIFRFLVLLIFFILIVSSPAFFRSVHSFF